MMGFMRRRWLAMAGPKELIERDLGFYTCMTVKEEYDLDK